MVEIKRYAGLVGLAVIFAAFILVLWPKVTSYSLNSDENAYFYMGKLVSAGGFPYRDFFLAHPPMNVFVNALIFKFFGFNFLLLKLVPLLATLVAAALLFLMTKKRYGLAAGFATIIFFLFQYNILRISTQSVGIDLTVMFMVAGVYFLLENKPRLSGLMLGLAALTGLYSLVLTAVLFAYLAAAKKAGSLKQLAISFLPLWLGVNVLLALFFGSKYTIPVYLYHLLKPGPQDLFFYNLKVLLTAVQLNLFLFLGAALIFLTREQKNLRLFIFIALAYAVFLVLLSKTFLFYFVLMFPFLTILAGAGLVRFSQRLRTLAYPIIIIFLLASSAYAVINFRNDFKPTDNKAFEEMAATIRENSKEEHEIFGDYYSVPLIALLADRRIANDVVDTNLLRFTSGVTSLNTTIQRLKSDDKLKFVILEAKRDLSYADDFVQFLRNDCAVVGRVNNERIGGDYFVFDCTLPPAASQNVTG